MISLPQVSRDEVVIALLCADEADNGGTHLWLKNNREILRLVRDGTQHAGDCTNAPHTCLRCLVDDTERRADALIDILQQQAAERG